jgi:RimJ/RimL family protein N-acetyltransferase
VAAVKEVRTDRLLLRQWREEDFEPYAAYYADAELARHVGGRSNLRLPLLETLARTSHRVP